MDDNIMLLLEKIKVLASLITSVKDVYYQDRSIKDDIIKKATEIIRKELTKLD
jgi:hypothetical protein